MAARVVMRCFLLAVTVVFAFTEERGCGQGVVTKRAIESLLETLVQQQASLIKTMQTEITGLKNRLDDLESGQPHQTGDIGTTYIRWGHSACPDPSNTVYSGFVGGSWYADRGSASNHLCLPRDPVMSGHRSSGVPARLLGAQYYTSPDASHGTDPVCALCRIPRSSSAMIAGTNRCWNGWKLEYSGYLMAGYHGDAGATEFVCFDRNLKHVFGSSADVRGRLLHFTIYYCGSLPCPPYVEGKTVLCAVCSK